MFEGKVIFVCVDSDEETYLMIADEAEADRYWREHPNTDRFECANAIGRELTEDERAALPVIEGCIAY